jgi:hypothetical protein
VKAELVLGGKENRGKLKTIWWKGLTKKVTSAQFFTEEQQPVNLIKKH